MYKSIACIGFVACISAAIGASFTLATTTSSIVTPFLYPGHSLFCVPQVTQLVAVQDCHVASVSRLAVTSRLPCHSVPQSDVAADSADSAASATPSSSDGHLNTSRATGGQSLVSPSDVAAVGRTLLTLLASNVQFLGAMNRIFVSLAPSRSSVLVCAPVASIDSGSSNASFGAPPLPLQGFQCAIFNTRRSRQHLNGRNESTTLLLHRAPVVIGTSLPSSMHLTSAIMANDICNTPAQCSFVAIDVHLSPDVATSLVIFALCILIFREIIFLPFFCHPIRSHSTTKIRAIGSCAAFAACALTMPLCITAQVGDCCQNDKRNSNSLFPERCV